MKIYLICSVRNAKPESISEAENYVKSLENDGHTVHYPPRDVDQTDDGVGLKICECHRKAMIECDEVHILFDPDSRGSLFDFGMAFVLNKPIRVVNDITRTKHKSYGNVMLELSKRNDFMGLCPFGSERE